MKFALALCCCLSFATFPLSAQTRSSVLVEGDFYQLAVQEKGIYRLDKKFLAELGLDVNRLDPRHLRLYGYGGGMLPQANSAPRPVDLPENAIFVAGEADGSFDEEDYILFYAEGPHQQLYDGQEQVFRLQQNLFSDETFYYLQVGLTAGKRIGPEPTIYGGTGQVAYFDDYIHHEKDLFNLLGSGREWYGEPFLQQDLHTFRYEVPGLRAGSKAAVAAAVMSQTDRPTHFDFSLNGQAAGVLPVRAAQSYAYGDKGVEEAGVVTQPGAFAGGGDQVELAIRLREGSGSLGYLNYFSLNFQRVLKLYGRQTFFRSVASTRHLISEFQIAEAEADYVVWDVTEPQAVKNQQYTRRENTARFRTYTYTLKEFVLFRGRDFPAPLFKAKVANQNLHGLPTPQLLLITHPDFEQEANRLAQFRRQDDGLTVAVVTTEQIYHEFSSGRQDVTALRDFVRHLYQNGPLQYVLLFGDASYDFKKGNGANTNFVPIYQSRNSLHNVLSYASDDYLAFLDPEEGEWPESVAPGAKEHDLDVGVGRLPVKTPAEARAVVDKLIHYGSHPRTLGDWRNRVAFVADDGDQNKHQHQSDFLASYVEQTHLNLNPDRVFVDAYPKKTVGSSKTSPAVRQRLDDQLKKGVLILDYIGHGGETAWANERILDLEMITNWDNHDRLPLILVATCEFGRYDDPERNSGAEVALLHPQGGAIALFTATRPVFPNTVIYVNAEFYKAAFTPVGGEMPRLGEVYRQTKNASVSGITNRNFSFLGDPSMRLAYPRHEIVVTGINGQPLPDQAQIRPLDKVTISGEVRQGQTVLPDFDGVVSAVVYDRKTEITTLGQETSPMTFQNRQDVIYRGQATLRKGKFEISFVAPKDLDQTLALGKISLYASHRSRNQDATGSYTALQVGGEPTEGPVDKMPPHIRLYLDVETFRSGGRVSPNTTLFVRLSDESGINSNNTQGNGIRAILNNDQKNPIDLSAFYVSDLDDYRTGSITYPFHNLPPGRHDILLAASDNHNNRASAFIEFYVLEGNVLFVHELTAFPNPSSEYTDFRFTLRHQAEDFSVSLTVYSATGQLVKQLKEDFTSIGEEQTVRWDRRDGQGSRVPGGIYFYTIAIESAKQPVHANIPLRGKLILLR